MDKKRAKLFFRTAMSYMVENYHDELDGLKKLSPGTLKNITSKEFLSEYCWVIYGSGFKISIIEDKFDGIKKAFKDFDIEKLSKIKSVEAVLRFFNNERKANSFLKGAQLIYREGFSKFKDRIQKEGPEALEELPGIGRVTKKLLARNIGLEDVAKDDVLIRRLVKYLDAADEKELVGYLSSEFGEKKGLVDGVLWRFCEQHAWKLHGYDLIEDYIKGLR